jgi:hypothetical protein
MEERKMPDEKAGQGESRVWEPPTMTYIGHVGDVLQSGGGKISSPPHDPGDTLFKPPGQA